MECINVKVGFYVFSKLQIQKIVRTRTTDINPILQNGTSYPSVKCPVWSTSYDTWKAPLDWNSLKPQARHLTLLLFYARTSHFFKTKKTYGKLKYKHLNCDDKKKKKKTQRAWLRWPKHGVECSIPREMTHVTWPHQFTITSGIICISSWASPSLFREPGLMGVFLRLCVSGRGL